MNTEVYFENISASISEKLSVASRSIRVAVAWFTDKMLFEILLQKVSEELDVIVIIRNDVINLGQSSLAWQKLIDAGGTLYFSPNSPALHHKFCVIDDDTLVSGSYNWTYGAKRNRENIVYTRQSEIVQAFQKEFGFLLDYAQEVTDLKEALAAYPPVTNIELQQQSIVEATLETEARQQQQGDDEYTILLKEAWEAYRQKLHQKAEAVLRKAIQFHPKEAEAHQLLASVYWRSDQNLKAVEAAKKAEEYGVKDASLWNTYGLACDGLRKYKEAISYFDRCIKAEPMISTWYFNKCFALERAGSIKASDDVALEGMQKATAEIKRNLDGGDTHRLLRAYIERGGLKKDKPEARKNAKLALNVYQQLPDQEKDLHDLDDINKILNF